MKVAIFLFDYTGIMAKPWADAGYLCFCFDGQHSKGVSKSNHENILNVCMWFSGSQISNNDIEKIIGVTGDDVSFVFGFPDCTDLTVAGARHFESKRAKNPYFQHEAMQLVYLVRNLGEALKCPWALENPVGVISSMWRKPDFSFNPCDYGKYLCVTDIHPLYPDIYPAQDAYNKKTCIWSGCGFIEPEKIPVKPKHKDNPGWRLCGGKSLRTKNIRSATPRGFAKAVFVANSNQY